MENENKISSMAGSAHCTEEIMSACALCPRECLADRGAGKKGFCSLDERIYLARAALHMWEEPCISGTKGSGAVFFSGCGLRCCFCQNSLLSKDHFGKKLTVNELGDAFLRLQDKGAYNINLVTPTQFFPDIIKALDLVRHKLHIPVVCNCGGYECPEIISLLKDYIDIWLPDFKYFDNELAFRYSKAKNYFEQASASIAQMIRQTGTPEYTLHPSSVPGRPDFPLMAKGVIIRHMVLPGHKDDSIRLLHWIHQHFPEHSYLVSLLSQYTPYTKNPDYPQLNRRITSYEYNKVVDTALELGMTDGFMQQKSSAKEEYTPPFNLEGL